MSPWAIIFACKVKQILLGRRRIALGTVRGPDRAFLTNGITTCALPGVDNQWRRASCRTSVAVVGGSRVAGYAIVDSSGTGCADFTAFVACSCYSVGDCGACWTLGDALLVVHEKACGAVEANQL